MRPKYKVADVLEMNREHLEKLCSNTWQLRTLHAIRRCRTQAMGGHIDKCRCCERLHISYNSCRNRHCPTCQGHKREEWIQARSEELLAVPYFHVVFTLPAHLNSICLMHPRQMYSILFKTAWATLRLLGDNPDHLGAKFRTPDLDKDNQGVMRI